MSTQRNWMLGALGLAAVAFLSSAVTHIAQDQAEDDAPALVAVEAVRGLRVPIRLADSDTSAENRPTAYVDSYLDWDNGKLIYMAEGGGIAISDSPSNWEVRTADIPDAGGMVTLCFQPGSGLTFVLNGETLEWEAIEEPNQELVIGDYDIRVSALDGSIFAVRFDKFSGRSWILEDDGWTALEGNLMDWPTEGEQR